MSVYTIAELVEISVKVEEGGEPFYRTPAGKMEDEATETITLAGGWWYSGV